MPELSLIICSRNRASALQACLQSLPLQDIKTYEGELVLVDSHSTDDTLEVMRSYKVQADFPVHVLHLNKAGLGRARNAGLRQAAGTIFIFTDDDCYLGEGYIRRVKNIFEERKLSYCGGRILLHDNTDAMIAVNYQEIPEELHPRSCITPGIIQGANMVIHRKVYEAIGGFLPNWGAGNSLRGEDIEYISRASMAGFRGAFIPELTVFHHHQRKPGKEVELLERSNAIARGALYALMIWRGHYGYWQIWKDTSFFLTSSRHQHLSYFTRIFYEAYGALRCLFGRKEP